MNRIPLEVHSTGRASCFQQALAHRAEKWTRFSVKNDAPLKEVSIGSIPKVESTFGSDALGPAGQGRNRRIVNRLFTMSERS
jgi:hypothetical protein